MGRPQGSESSIVAANGERTASTSALLGRPAARRRAQDYALYVGPTVQGPFLNCPLPPHAVGAETLDGSHVLSQA